jgi:tRNA threonylcarbamoyladenosine biosynthesis protein TsaB
MKSPGFVYQDFALAFETSSALGSVALGRGPEILGVRQFTKPRAHAVEFAPTIDSLCRDHGADPKAIGSLFVSAGPGSFTGLRIGITAARTVALAVGANIVALPTLEVIAQNALEAQPRPARVAVVLDAKRGHVYACAFEFRSGGFEPVEDPREADPSEFLALQPRDCVVLGEGVHYHRPAMEASGLRVLPEVLFPPNVKTVYRLGAERAAQGRFTTPRDLTPVYIRPPEAEEVWIARQGAGDLRPRSEKVSG